MDYKVIFDMQTSEIRLANYSYILMGAALFLIGAFTYFFRYRLSNPLRKRPMPLRLPHFLLLFGALWMQISGVSLYAHYQNLERALKKGHIEVVEGRVVHFTPASYATHGTEKFCISESETCFSYSAFTVTPGFNQTAADGSPIVNGLPVRVTYKDNTILKLEAAKKPMPPQQDAKDAPPPEIALSPAR